MLKVPCGLSIPFKLSPRAKGAIVRTVIGFANDSKYDILCEENMHVAESRLTSGFALDINLEPRYVTWQYVFRAMFGNMFISFTQNTIQVNFLSKSLTQEISKSRMIHGEYVLIKTSARTSAFRII